MSSLLVLSKHETIVRKSWFCSKLKKSFFAFYVFLYLCLSHRRKFAPTLLGINLSYQHRLLIWPDLGQWLSATFEFWHNEWLETKKNNDYKDNNSKDKEDTNNDEDKKYKDDDNDSKDNDYKHNDNKHNNNEQYNNEHNNNEHNDNKHNDNEPGVWSETLLRYLRKRL